jgi:hypothetical protein
MMMMMMWKKGREKNATDFFLARKRRILLPGEATAGTFSTSAPS